MRLNKNKHQTQSPGLWHQLPQILPLPPLLRMLQLLAPLLEPPLMAGVDQLLTVALLGHLVPVMKVLMVLTGTIQDLMTARGIFVLEGM
jgi:hypothetical protein